MRRLFGKKLKSKRGFTLAETLLAVLILLLVATIVAMGVPSAKNAYEKVVLASNAETLLSTTVSALRNELGTATKIEPGDKVGENFTSLTFFNETRGSTSKIYLDTGGAIMLQRYVETDGMGVNSTPVRLVSQTASTADLYVTYDSVAYADGIVTFTGLSVNRQGSTGLAERASLSIRVIADDHN